MEAGSVGTTNAVDDADDKFNNGSSDDNKVRLSVAGFTIASSVVIATDALQSVELVGVDLTRGFGLVITVRMVP